MALTYTNSKNATGALNLSTSWTPNATPSAAMIGGWIGTSGTNLGLGANITLGAMRFETTSPAITIPAGSTLTLAGASDGTNTYFVDCAASTTQILSCAVSLGTSAGIISSAGAFVFSGAFAKSVGALTLTGGGAYVFGANNASTFTVAVTQENGNASFSTGGLGAGSWTISGAAQLNLNPGTAASTTGRNFTINADTTFSASGNTATMTLTGTVDLGSSTRTLTFPASSANAAVLFQGAISGSAGFIKAGAGIMTLTAANTLSGDISVTAGTLTTTTSVNTLQNATLNWTGTVGTFTPLTGSNIGAIKGSTTTNTLALGTAAINVGGYNSSETFSGKFTGSALITKNGTGTWTLDGDNSGHTGGFTVNGGTLVAGSATAIGGTTGAITVNSGYTLQVTASPSKSSATLTLNGSGVSGNGALRSASGTNTYTASGYTLTTTSTVNVDAGKLTLASAGAIIGGTGLTKIGAGELDLPQTASTFDGAVSVNAGKVTFYVAANAGSPSSLGRGNTTPAISLTGTLNYAGTTSTSTSRSIDFTGAAPVLEATGTGAVTYSACSTTGLTGGRLITFTGTSNAANVFSANIADGTGAVTVAKTGDGTWNLTGTMTHTGGTDLSVGTLGGNGGSVSHAADLRISGGTLANGSFTVPVVATGGTVTATLVSTSSLTVNSGSAVTISPTATANTYTGATAVNTGGIAHLVTTVDPATSGTGKVLGNSAVTVTGTIKTSASGVQAGKMRYGTGGLTFNNGAKLYIGGV